MTRQPCAWETVLCITVSPRGDNQYVGRATAALRSSIPVRGAPYGLTGGRPKLDCVSTVNLR